MTDETADETVVTLSDETLLTADTSEDVKEEVSKEQSSTASDPDPTASSSSSSVPTSTSEESVSVPAELNSTSMDSIPVKLRSPVGSALLQWQESVNVKIRENNLIIARRSKKCALIYGRLQKRYSEQQSKMDELISVMNEELAPNNLRLVVNEIETNNSSDKSESDAPSSAESDSDSKTQTDKSSVDIDATNDDDPKKEDEMKHESVEYVSKLTLTISRIYGALETISNRVGLLQNILKESMQLNHEKALDDERDKQARAVDTLQENWKKELERKQSEIDNLRSVRKQSLEQKEQAEQHKDPSPTQAIPSDDVETTVTSETTQSSDIPMDQDKEQSK